MPENDLIRSHGRIEGSADEVPGTVAAMHAEFQEFHESQFHAVVTFLRLNGARLHQAEDAAQEAFLDAWREFAEPGRWQKIDNPAGWIRTVALRRYRALYSCPDFVVDRSLFVADRGDVE